MEIIYFRNTTILWCRCLHPRCFTHHSGIRQMMSSAGMFEKAFGEGVVCSAVDRVRGPTGAVEACSRTSNSGKPLPHTGLRGEGRETFLEPKRATTLGDRIIIILTNNTRFGKVGRLQRWQSKQLLPFSHQLQYITSCPERKELANSKQR